MVYQIDTDKLEKHSLSLGAVLLALAQINNVNLNAEAAQLVVDGEGDTSFENISFNTELKPIILRRVNAFLLDCTPTQSPNEQLVECATYLKSLFPQGKKPGTAQYWADSPKLIVERLKLFFKRFGEYPLEDIKRATEKYVQENASNPYMRTLKYFIIKNDTKGGEVERNSDLLNYLENMNEVDSSDDSNFVTLF